MAAYTAAQIREMVEHIERCDDCGDAEIRAGLYDESLPPVELEDYITSTHSPAWREFLARHTTP